VSSMNKMDEPATDSPRAADAAAAAAARTPGSGFGKPVSAELTA